MRSVLLLIAWKKENKIKNKLSWKMEYTARWGKASKLCFNTNRKFFSTLIALMSEIVIVFHTNFCLDTSAQLASKNSWSRIFNSLFFKSARKEKKKKKAFLCCSSKSWTHHTNISSASREQWSYSLNTNYLDSKLLSTFHEVPTVLQSGAKLHIHLLISSDAFCGNVQ